MENQIMTTLKDSTQIYAPRGFASDNNAGIHPEILESITRANAGHVHGYGDDPYTSRATAQFKKHFGDDAEIFLMFNGTGANVAALSAMVKPWSAIICAQSAHINMDESSAPERFIGCRLTDVPTPDGKLTVDLIRQNLRGIGDVHHVQAAVIAITQPTEFGTLYSLSEIKAITAFAHDHGMMVFLDGARISNAAASLELPFAAFTREAGIDAMSFGGTKIGLMLGEAVVLFKPELAQDFGFIRKQAMQLSSKMRFLACQFETLLEDDLWLRNAKQANAMAQRLARALEGIPEVQITQKVQANAVFATMARDVIEALRETYFFYDWNETINEVRLMASFDTTQADVEGLVSRLKSILESRADK
jgi:threonine aldolase